MDYYYSVVAVLAYLLGSIPFGYILVRVFLKQDIRSTGSGNIGATNVARSGKKGLAIATLLLDGFKGSLAVWLSLWVLAAKWAPYSKGGLGGAHSWLSTDTPPSIQAFAALIAILGHMFPIWLRFKGGKGVATAAGAFLALSPAALLVAVIVFASVFAVSRYVSLGSILAAIVFPLAAYFIQKPQSPTLIAMTVSAVLVVLKHHENIRRLIAGTENKFGGKKSVPPPDAMEKQA